MDRKTLEEVRRFIDHKIADADRAYKTSPSDDVSRRAGHCKQALEDVRAYLQFELSSLTASTPVEPAKVDDSLSYHDLRKQLDEARAELARIARLAQEAIR